MPATQLYDTLISQLLARPSLTVASVLDQMLSSKGNTMQLSDQLVQIDQLKTWLDSFRPLPASVVRELKQRYDVRFTYQSNAIEGNTLSQSEIELVLSKGITIGGKTLTEHLEVVGHKEAIDYIEAMSEFVQWLQTAWARTHPILYASEAHYRFVSIHPFADGNGRTGRLMRTCCC